MLVDFTYDLPSLFVPIIGQQSITPAYAAAVPGAVINPLRVDTTVPALGAGVFPIAFRFTAAVQVGSTLSIAVPVYAIPGQ